MSRAVVYETVGQVRAVAEPQAGRGEVRVLAVQSVGLAGARVVGTASPGTFGFLREPGAAPVENGPGLADRVRAMGPADLHRITDVVLAGRIAIPTARTFPLERIRDAVPLPAGRHVHGKVVVIP